MNLMHSHSLNKIQDTHTADSVVQTTYRIYVDTYYPLDLLFAQKVSKTGAGTDVFEQFYRS